MKSLMKKVCVLLIVATALVAVQTAGAEPVIVSGPIEVISNHPNMIVVDETEVYGVKFNYLCNQYNICLEEGETVTVSTYEYNCTDGSTKLMATSITVGDVTVTLR